MGVSPPGIAQKNLGYGIVVPGDMPLPQDLLPIGVGKCRPPLADVAGAHPQLSAASIMFSAAVAQSSAANKKSFGANRVITVGAL